MNQLHILRAMDALKRKKQSEKAEDRETHGPTLDNLHISCQSGSHFTVSFNRHPCLTLQ